MKLNLFFSGVVAILSSLAFAQTPSYIPKANGVVLNGAYEAGDFLLNPGELLDCKGSDGVEPVGYRCNLRDAQASVVNNGVKRIFQFDQVGLGRWKIEGELVWSYVFMGTWKADAKKITLKSRVRVKLFRYASDPLHLRGTLELIDYPITQGVDAVLESNPELL